MALRAFKDTLNDEKIHVYPRIENGNITGIIGTKLVEVQLPSGLKQYGEVAYVLQKVGRKEVSKLERAKKEIKELHNVTIDYSVHDVKDEKLKKQGLKKVVFVGFAGTRDQKNYDEMSIFNELLGFKDDDPNVNLGILPEGYLDILFEEYSK
jgi:hypothetical protein